MPLQGEGTPEDKLAAEINKFTFPKRLVVALYIDSYDNNEFEKRILDEINENSFVLIIYPEGKSKITNSSPLGRKLDDSCAIREMIPSDHVFTLLSGDRDRKNEIGINLIQKCMDDHYKSRPGVSLLSEDCGKVMSAIITAGGAIEFDLLKEELDETERYSKEVVSKLKANNIVKRKGKEVVWDLSNDKILEILLGEKNQIKDKFTSLFSVDLNDEKIEKILNTYGQVFYQTSIQEVAEKKVIQWWKIHRTQKKTETAHALPVVYV